MRSRVGLCVVVFAAQLIIAGCDAPQSDHAIEHEQFKVAVTWANPVGVLAEGNNLTKTDPTGAWDAGAVSVETLEGTGSLTFTTGENTTYKMVGLSNGDTDQNYTDIDFAFYLNGNGLVLVYEGGAQRGVFGPYLANDTFRIDVVGTEVRYYQNDVLLYVSTTAPTFPLIVDTSLYTQGATVQNVDISQNVWLNPVGVTVTSNSLTKTGAEGWNAGAASVQSINGDGYVEFSSDENNTGKMLGLSNGDTDQNFTDIDFAIYLTENGEVAVYESGTQIGTFGIYQPGEPYRVVASGGEILYQRNGTTFYTSQVPPSFPLRIDSSLLETGATLVNISLVDSFWQNAAGVVTTLNSLAKSGAVGWNAGASTTATIDGDGYMEFSTAEATTYKMVGLSNGDTDQNYTDIDFAIYLTGAGAVAVYEGGVRRGVFGAYSAGDTFRVEAVGNQIFYSRNGATFYTSAGTPTFPLRGDTSLYSPGATVNDVEVQESFWQNIAGASALGSDIVKIGTTGWNAGAFSINAIGSSGALEFSTGENNTAKMIGLSNGDTDQTFQDIDFAVYLTSSGLVGVYEGGNNRGIFGSYVAGDLFRVEVNGGVVTYLQNGGVFYTSALAPTLPLNADVSMNTPGASLTSVSITDEFWGTTTGVQTSGNNLTKLGSIGWNAGAATAAGIPALANGFAEFTTGEANTWKMAGLTATDSSAHYSDIDYAIYMNGAGILTIYEAGSSVSVFGTYTPGDVLRVEAVGGVVSYYQNGALFYTSAVPALAPLVFDSSLYSTGATIQSVTVGTF